MEAPLKELALSVGSYVEHVSLGDLGVGKVFCLSAPYACVGFINSTGKRQVMRLYASFLRPVQAPIGQAFEGWTVSTTSTCGPVVPSSAGKPMTAKWTKEEALQRFLAQYPDGFGGSQYLAAERIWKVRQRDLWLKGLDGQTFRSRIETDPAGAGALVSKVITTLEAPMLAVKGELPSYTWALKHSEPANYLRRLADVLDEGTPSSETFDALIDSLGSLQGPAPAPNLLKWPVLTAMPFLLRPDVHILLKPTPTRRAAKAMGVELSYNSAPSWPTYKRLLEWSGDLLAFLAPHGATDMIDVQSFIWAIAGPDSGLTGRT